KLISSSTGIFLFKFENCDSNERILNEGPWDIWGVHIALRKWEKNLPLDKDYLDKVPLWVKLYNIPVALWSDAGLGYIASGLGVPLYMDSTTADKAVMVYARIFIKFHASSSFPSFLKRIQPDGSHVEIGVKYQWRPATCNHCRVFGHPSYCPAVPKGNQNNTLAEKTTLSKEANLYPTIRKGKEPTVEYTGKTLPSVVKANQPPVSNKEGWIEVSGKSKNSNKKSLHISNSPITSNMIRDQANIAGQLVAPAHPPVNLGPSIESDLPFSMKEKSTTPVDKIVPGPIICDASENTNRRKSHRRKVAILQVAQEG
ncbi:DUF4283 domain-containing protein, partial [Cephalotus follicularis]